MLNLVKKLKIKQILLALIIFPCLFLMFACENYLEVFKINFVVDGVVYDTIETSGNTSIILPDSPSKRWYVFEGWYFDNGVFEEQFTESSLLNTPLKKNINVYAKFKLDPKYFEIKVPNCECVISNMVLMDY